MPTMTTTTIPPLTSLYTFTPSHPTHLHCPSYHSRMFFFHYYTFNISSTVSAIITLPCHTNFTSTIVLPWMTLPNPINSIFSFHPMSPYYNISYTCSSSHFISSLPVLQYNHQSIQSLPFYHSINIFYLPSILYSSSFLSLLPYQQLILYKPLPILCIPHHFSFFRPSLHLILLYPPSNLPFYYYISFNHIHHPLLYAPLPHHAYVLHTFSTVPHTPRPQL